MVPLDFCPESGLLVIEEKVYMASLHFINHIVFPTELEFLFKAEASFFLQVKIFFLQGRIMKITSLPLSSRLTLMPIRVWDIAVLIYSV